MGISAKVEIVEVKQEFPVIMKSVRSGAVVLFESEQCGTYLIGDGQAKISGDHTKSLLSCFDRSVWTKIHSITLTNE